MNLFVDHKTAFLQKVKNLKKKDESAMFIGISGVIEEFFQTLRIFGRHFMYILIFSIHVTEGFR